MILVLFALAVSFVLMVPMFWLPVDQAFLVGLGLLYLWMLIGFKIRRLDDLLITTLVFSGFALVILITVQNTIHSKLWIYQSIDKVSSVLQLLIGFFFLFWMVAIAVAIIVILLNSFSCGGK